MTSFFFSLHYSTALLNIKVLQANGAFHSTDLNVSCSSKGATQDWTVLLKPVSVFPDELDTTKLRPSLILPPSLLDYGMRNYL